MKLRHDKFIFFLLAPLIFSLPLLLRAAENGNGSSPEGPAAHPASTASPVLPKFDEGRKKLADNGQTEEIVELQVLKQRYNRDATGVRARLGMCRKKQGGHGDHHRHRGGERWNTH